MERMEGSSAAAPDATPEDIVSKPARHGGSLANGAAAKKAIGHAAGQTPARDTGQGEDPVQRLTQVVHRWLTPSVFTTICLRGGSQSQHPPRITRKVAMSASGAYKTSGILAYVEMHCMLDLV